MSATSPASTSLATSTAESRTRSPSRSEAPEEPSASTLKDSDVAASVVARLERCIQGLDRKLASAINEQQAAKAGPDHPRVRIGTPFEHAEDLERLRRRQAAIDDALLATEISAVPTPGADDELISRLVTHERFWAGELDVAPSDRRIYATS